jgi:hypothetical protein
MKWVIRNNPVSNFVTEMDMLEAKLWMKKMYKICKHYV